MKIVDYVLPMEYTEKIEAVRFVRSNAEAVAVLWPGIELVRNASTHEIVRGWLTTEGQSVTFGDWVILRPRTGRLEVVKSDDFRKRFTVVP